MTSKDAQFQLTKVRQVAFEVMKKKLASPPELSLSEFGKPLIVETDAFTMAVDSVLWLRETAGKVHLERFGSRVMLAAERIFFICEQ